MYSRVAPIISLLSLLCLGLAETFDFVIVGGCTAGLTLAYRSSDSNRATVAVIEAGGFYENEFPAAEIPGLDYVGAGMGPSVTSPIDWNFVTEPQRGANERMIDYARGKCMGGSSARNIMWYHRATVGAYQTWSDEVGDESYTWDKFLPYYKKSVYWTPPNPSNSNATIRYNASSFELKGGPLQASYSTYTHPIFSWFAKIMAELGYPEATDFSGGVLDGYKYMEETIGPITHLRSSSQSSFYGECQSRSNLKIFTHSLVEKVIFNNRRRAIGVIVNGTQISAKREVVLSAGTSGGPSGSSAEYVGPHHVRPSMEVIIPTAATNSSMARAQIEWDMNRTGPLTSPNADAAGFGRLNSTTLATLSAGARKTLQHDFPDDRPKLEYLPQAGFTANQSGDSLPPSSANYASWVMGLVKPFSRSTVTLKSSSPHEKPIVDPNWLTHPFDQKIAIAAFRIARQIIHSEAMLPLLADPTQPESSTGLSVTSDEEILNYARDTIATIWHAAGTCKMGQQSDEYAVVDPACRVYGFQGLRVVDASAFPFLPPGHPQSTVYALAEKIADDMLMVSSHKPSDEL